MPQDPTLPLQKAIFDHLCADGTLMGMVNGVFDFVPQNTQEPYVTIGDGTSVDFDSHTFTGMDFTRSIHTWFKGAGRKGCLEIMARIYDLLHEATLTVTGFTPIVLRQEFSECLIDSDGQTFHGVQRFRIILGGN